MSAKELAEAIERFDKRRDGPTYKSSMDMNLDCIGIAMALTDPSPPDSAKLEAMGFVDSMLKVGDQTLRWASDHELEVSYSDDPGEWWDIRPRPQTIGDLVHLLWRLTRKGAPMITPSLPERDAPHKPEPWYAVKNDVIWNDGKGSWDIRDDEGEAIATYGSEGVCDVDISKADADRIVACVNALAGVPDPAAYVAERAAMEARVGELKEAGRAIQGYLYRTGFEGGGCRSCGRGDFHSPDCTVKAFSKALSSDGGSEAG